MWNPLVKTKTPLTESCLFLAPMHGVTDAAFREIISELGGVDLCVTEFIRVSQQLLPTKEFLKYCPEINSQGRTSSGTPVILQLLGGQASPMAENAARASEMGAFGIDLNFGCPAPIVNRHDGGAILLRNPERLFEITSQVRAAVSREKTVSAKMRLGYETPELAIENALALESAGASWITVHARTKTDGYRPPAYWEWITKIRETVKIPIVANGEIWNFADMERCKRDTGCDSFMIGRGILRQPFLFKSIQSKNCELLEWENVIRFLEMFFTRNSLSVAPHFAQARTKMWLNNLRFAYPEAQQLFDQIKAICNPSDFEAVINRKSNTNLQSNFNSVNLL